MTDDKWLVYMQSRNWSYEERHACVGCCHYERTGVLLYSCEQERGRQTGGEEKAEGRDGEDINGEPH